MEAVKFLKEEDRMCDKYKNKRQLWQTRYLL